MSIRPEKIRHPIARALIITTRRGKIQFADRNARRWLRDMLGYKTTGSHLPRRICRWLLKTDKKPLALRVQREQQPAKICLTRKTLTNHSVTLLLELVSGSAVTESSRRYRDLTAREQEVLFWLARGKTNADIAAILGVAPATVGKHLERIYPKLGVENRTAAASMMSQTDDVRTTEHPEKLALAAARPPLQRSD